MPNDTDIVERLRHEYHVINHSQFLLDAAAEIERLRGIVSKLPLTADGVPVVPGMVVYTAYAVEEGGVAFALYDTDGARIWGRGRDHFYPDELFSTREAAVATESARAAALAAKGGGE